ncbi:hypothetical protein AARAC_000990 [Aspergillus arachidicola]|uniref:Zn(2)-C6 fungal-type domain-containing protein n=1 Tax=Aspergillus arachidicola TaxID=656916 RepID=A0A2G7G6W1_9EURO|nr:hypothetical protein AARAC_000990 [Aspergillus arachidicola]
MSSSASKKGKRTNSLAFARTDCHTCASNGQVCDRRRPQCTTCLEQGRKCGGFTLPLSWDNSRIWLGKPAQKTFLPSSSFDDGLVDQPAEEDAENDSNPVGADGGRKTDSAKHFRFVLGSSGRRKRRKTHGVHVKNSVRSSIGTQQQRERHNDISPSPRAPGEDILFTVPTGLSSPLFDSFSDFTVPYFDDAELFPLDDPSAQVIMPLDEPNGPGQAAQNDPLLSRDASGGLVQELHDALDTDLPFLATDVPQPDTLVVSSLRTPPAHLNPTAGVNGILGNQHETLLRMYDTEFCILPLTSDTALNPFRCRDNTSQGSRLLFNSILALCFQHLNHQTGTWAAEAIQQRVNATKLLDDALQSDQLVIRGLTLLDPILIMFTLDCTLSALGTWATHLHRVRSILEACGGPSALDNPRICSQAGMVIWWDATLALISRQGTAISKRYLDHLVRSERQGKWSFYDLTGCPGDLVAQLFQLADLAKQSEIASSMTWLTFDLTPVMELERQIRNWKATSFASVCGLSEGEGAVNHTADEAADEESLHAQQDRHHCAEAWRCALLLYIERIFKWDRKAPRPKAIARLVRATLTHVRACRRTSQTQKQLLLPVFLAGSETSDADMRDFVIQYCKWWGEKSRYHMFNSVPSLLKEIWDGRSTRTGQNAWWGEVVDRKTGPQGTCQAPMQFLFG